MRCYKKVAVVLWVLATGLAACGREPAPSQGLSTQVDIVPPADDAYDFRDHIVWSETGHYAWNGDDHGSAFLRDIMTATTDRFSSQYGATTMAHETNHGLLSEMRQKTGARDNFVYFEGGKGAFVTEPQTQFSMIRNYLPARAGQIASGRYQTYLVDQARSWSEMLYCFDEWNSYVVGARVGLEIYDAGNWGSGAQDVVDGAMDFLYFGSAAVMALKDLEPDYFATNEQFKAAFAMLAEQSLQLVRRGLAVDKFNVFHAPELYEHYINSPDNAAIRQTLRDWYGPEWAERVLGLQ